MNDLFKLSLRKTVSLFIMVLAGLAFYQCNPDTGAPYSPEESMKNIKIPEGFRLELVVSEPLIKDPVDIAFAPNGDLYVVEMPEYPSAAEGGPSTIVRLTDTNGDGKYDTRTVFAEDLPFVNGVMPWKDGVLVTNAPDIIYFEDTNGDGKADVREVVLSGFATTNPQLRVSSLRYGLDNWIYGAHFNAFGSGGDAQFEGKGEPLFFPEDPSGVTYDIKPGMDFRFRPDDYQIERSGGVSQFGNTFDSYGNRFTLMNADHIRHVVIPHRYAAQNPYFPLTSEMESISDHGRATRLYSITEDMQDFRSSAHEVGHVTSACGNCIYNGGIFPEEYSNTYFFCDPQRNVVHADHLSVNGATFTASRIAEEEEFMASTENWFRPVNTTIGPDGALYVVDMYRKLVEHPAFIPHSGVLTEEGGYQTQVGIILESDFYDGQDLGRIYRIVPEDHKTTNPSFITDESAGLLIEHFENPNYWWRINAQRLLVERQDPSVREKLEEFLQKEISPEGRIHALWTLEGLGVLDEAYVIRALEDENPMVRKQGIVLAETRLDHPEIQKRLVTMMDEPDVHVRFQLALTLNMIPHEKSGEARYEIARQHMTDDWFQAAALLGITDEALLWHEKISEITAENEAEEKSQKDFIRKIAIIIGSRQNSSEITALLSRIDQETRTSIQLRSLEGLNEGLRQGGRFRNLSPQGKDMLVRLMTSEEETLQSAALSLAEAVEFGKHPSLVTAVAKAQRILGDEESLEARQVAAVRITGLYPEGVDLDHFDRLLSPQRSQKVQSAAAKVLIDHPGEKSVNLLLSRWNTFPLEIRQMLEKEFLNNQDLTFALLHAIEDGDIKSSLLTNRSISQLKQNPNEKIRDLASELLDSYSLDDRKKVAAEYYDATIMSGDIANGKLVFEDACSQCHQFDGSGYEVGPDLLTYIDRDKNDILKAILIPNNDIAPGFEGIIIQTKEGRTFTGVIVNETSSQVVLRNIGGGEQTLHRDNIESIRTMEVSLMPDGLEAGIDLQEMADLLEYLKSFN